MSFSTFFGICPRKMAAFVDVEHLLAQTDLADFTQIRPRVIADDFTFVLSDDCGDNADDVPGGNNDAVDDVLEGNKDAADDVLGLGGNKDAVDDVLGVNKDGADDECDVNALRVGLSVVLKVGPLLSSEAIVWLVLGLLTFSANFLSLILAFLLFKYAFLFSLSCLPMQKLISAAPVLDRLIIPGTEKISTRFRIDIVMHYVGHSVPK